MRIKGLARAAGTAGLGVALSGLLAGCDVQRHIDATCDDQGQAHAGFVDAHAQIPASVAAGSTFTITVNEMVGYPAEATPGDNAIKTGVLSVTGPVTPSGTFSVGQNRFGTGQPFPNDLTFTVTGQPGDRITVDAVSGTSTWLVFPGFEVHFDCTAVDPHLADITVADT
jgi:hypothetical protein